MWNITIINDQCPFNGTVKQSTEQFYPCDHEHNHTKKCIEKWCPLVTKQSPCQSCFQAYDEGDETCEECGFDLRKKNCPLHGEQCDRATEQVGDMVCENCPYEHD